MKMNEQSMMRLSLVCSLVGLAAIYGTALPSKPRMTPIAAINDDFIGTTVRISGQVCDLRSSDDGHLFLKLQDESGGIITVPIFRSLRRELDEPIELLDFLYIRGEVKRYRGVLEVVPADPRDLRVIHTAPVAVSNIGRENLGNAVKVQGVVVDRSIVGSGHLILTVGENGSQLSVFVPGWIAGNGFPEVDIGSEICASGWLQLYNDIMELKITSPGCVRVVEGT